jgi:photosystem II stability/assembly factor-like uncharacterized protein
LVNWWIGELVNLRCGVQAFAFAAILAAVPLPRQPSWTTQTSGVTARLRGVSAVSPNVVWASGAAGTVIRTSDGGKTWRRLAVPEAEQLEFRDVDAVDERTAYLLSIGSGAASRIYKTSDAGATWTLQFRNEDPKAFYDAMAFRNAVHGFAFSDSVEDTFVILRTDDGVKWTRVPPAALPAALPGEGAYAASGTNVVVRDNVVWIGTAASRILRSSDAGQSWTVFKTPIPASTSAGIFSLAFRDRSNGIAVGGDYKKEDEAIDNAAITRDGGRTWTLIKGLSGYRSAVAYVPAAATTWVAVGPKGADVSTDDGKTWTPLTNAGFHAVSFAPASRTGWAVGENGSVARVDF